MMFKRIAKYATGLLMMTAAGLGGQEAGCSNDSVPSAASSPAGDAGAPRENALAAVSTCTAAIDGSQAKIVYSTALSCTEEGMVGACALDPLALTATSEADPTTGVSTTRWTITRGATTVLTKTSRSANGSTSVELVFGPAFQGIGRAAFTDDGATLQGSIDGRAIVPAAIATLRGADGIAFVDQQSRPAIQVAAGTFEAISRLSDKVTTDAAIVCPASGAASPGQTMAPAVSALTNALWRAPAYKSTGATHPSVAVGQQAPTAAPTARLQPIQAASSRPGLARVAQNAAAPRGAPSGVRVLDAPLGVWVPPVEPSDQQNNSLFWATPDCQSCEGSCATDPWSYIIPGGLLLCEADCFIPSHGCAEQLCSGAIASCDKTESCCGSICCGAGSVCGNDPNADGICCPADHPVACGDATQQGCYVDGSTCCGSLNVACNPGDVCVDPLAGTCCPASQACGGACCGAGQSCQTTSTGGSTCCQTPLCGDQCCDGGNCANGGVCCFGPVDASGNCCGGILANVCNGQCCSGSCTADGSCCSTFAGSVVCGSACCPSGQACLDPNNSVCGAAAQPTLQLLDPTVGTVDGQSGGPAVFVSNSGTFNVTGLGYLPGLLVTLSVDSPGGAQINTVFADGNGSFTGVPVGTWMFSGGSHQLVGWQTDGSGNVVQTSISLFVESLQ